MRPSLHRRQKAPIYSIMSFKISLLRGRLVAGVAVALLGACADRQNTQKPPSTPAPPATERGAPPTVAGRAPQSGLNLLRPVAKLDYAVAAEGAGIDVSTRDRIGLSEASLIWPDGRESRAASIARETVQIPLQGRGFGVGVGAAGGSSSGVDTGVFVEIPVNIFGERAPRTERVVDSRARLAIDDERAYRRLWREMRVRLKFGFVAGETEVQELPAPRPEG